MNRPTPKQKMDVAQHNTDECPAYYWQEQIQKRKSAEEGEQQFFRKDQ
jgi:hypothetical protein